MLNYFERKKHSLLCNETVCTLPLVYDMLKLRFVQKAVYFNKNIVFLLEFIKTDNLTDVNSRSI